MQTHQEKLYRSKHDKIIAGVCGGLGEYFKVDPVLFRILFVTLALLDGVGILLYIILVFVIPPEGKHLKTHENFEERVKDSAENFKQEAEEFAQKIQGKSHWFSERKNIVALIIIVIGVLALLRQTVPMPWLNLSVLGPAIIIVIGLFIILKK